jgi:hypothetical protein
MARRKTMDPMADLSKIAEILERELSIQRDAIERLKTLGTDARVTSSSATVTLPVRRTA